MEAPLGERGFRRFRNRSTAAVATNPRDGVPERFGAAMMNTVIRRICALLVCAIGLAACQLDVGVDVVVNPDGTGDITMVATADAELVNAVPNLIDDLVLDDAIAAGWDIDGPTTTDDGGLTLTMSHEFLSANEATNLLLSLGPPFTAMRVARGTSSSGDVTTNQLEGRLVLTNGFETFADSDLIAAVGSLPFAEELAASGATPSENMSVTIRASLPGVVNNEATNGEKTDDAFLTWTAPLDGSVLAWSAETTQAPAEGQRWARPLSIAALVLLIAWVAFMALFICFVVFARWRRARRHRQRQQARRLQSDLG